MRYLPPKDNRRRNNFKKSELDSVVFKTLKNNYYINKILRPRIDGFFFYTFRNFNKTYIVNRCTITGRSGSVYKDFRVSRLQIRDMLSKGEFFGLKKSTW
jgi:ribosomal protein S14